MFPIDQSTAASSLPTPAAAGTPGFFTGGNPASGTPATVVDPDWLNMIQQELINIVDAGGETPSKTTYNQVLLAIKALIAQPQTNLVSGVVGQVRNLFATLGAASATATWTADEIIAEAALGGPRYCLSGFNKTCTLTGTGAGGMDAGAAPVSGFVAVYAIYNPTTGISALLATNCTSIVAPNVYGGANMPSGYTASALISVIATTSGSLFSPFTQRDREITVVNKTIISTTSGNSTPTSFATTSFPKNAVRVKGYSSYTSSAAATVNAGVYADAAGSDASIVGLTSSVGAFGIAGSFDILISAPQTIYYTLTATTGAPSWAANLERYSI